MKNCHMMSAMSIYAYLPKELLEFVFNFNSLSSILKVKQLQSPINICDYLSFH